MQNSNHAHTYIHIHTDTHIYTHTHTHTYTAEDIMHADFFNPFDRGFAINCVEAMCRPLAQQVSFLTYIRIYMHTYVYTYIHTYIHAYMP